MGDLLRAIIGSCLHPLITVAFIIVADVFELRCIYTRVLLISQARRERKRERERGGGERERERRRELRNEDVSNRIPEIKCYRSNVRERDFCARLEIVSSVFSVD